MKIKLAKSAQKKLIKIQQIEYEQFLRIKRALLDLEIQGLKSPNLKILESKYKIFRKRVGRWRILFIQSSSEEILILIIDIKKSKRDYLAWLNQIYNYLKFNF